MSFVVNILDMAEAIGEDEVRRVLSDFSCQKNPEVEDFVKRNALNFAKQKIAVTYFVMEPGARLQGVFALTHKVVQVIGVGMSETTKKKLSRYGGFDEETGAYTISAFLIAQLGKNSDCETALKGKDLLAAAMSVLRQVQKEIGGGLVYLECEDKPELLTFYQREENGFHPFGKRYSTEDKASYIQLLRLF